MKKTVLLTTLTAVSLSVTLNVGAVIAPETILPESTLAVLTVRDLLKECAEELLKKKMILKELFCLPPKR